MNLTYGNGILDLGEKLVVGDTIRFGFKSCNFSSLFRSNFYNGEVKVEMMPYQVKARFDKTDV